MKRILTAFITLVLLPPLFGAGPEAPAAGPAPAPGGKPSATACVYQYKGAVYLLEPGYEFWNTIERAVPLKEGARIKTGPGAWCQILAGDGTFINLDENSETLIETLRLEKESVCGEGASKDCVPKPAKRDYGFNFIKGRILWMAAKVKHKLSRFEIRTPSAVCAVRGTDFSINVTSSTADIGLFEGQLDIRSGGKETVLSAGTEAVAAPGSDVQVSARLSRLMEAEKRRYLKLQKHVEDLRLKLEAREDFIDDFVQAQQKKLKDFEDRKREKLEKRK